MLSKSKSSNYIENILFGAVAPSTKKPEKFIFEDVGDYILFGVKPKELKK